MSLPIALLRSARGLALRAADQAGLNAMTGRGRWRRERLLILCYHGVSLRDEHEWSDLYVSPAHLERRLQLLRAMGAHVLPLEEALHLMRRGTLPPLAVSLTFDDGAYDFSHHAAPIMAAADVPSMLYLTTYYSGRKQPVFDTMASYLMWKARGQSLRLPGLEETAVIPSTIHDAAFAALHTRFRQFAFDRRMSADEKHELLRALAERVRIDFDDLVDARLLQIMTPAEVQQLDARVSIQLHTHRHRTPRDAPQFAQELIDNAQAIHVSRPTARLNHFCYPSGDYVTEYAAWLRDANVEWATTCDPGFASTGADPYFLPRFIDSEVVSEAAFSAWVSGLSRFFFAGRTTKPVRLVTDETAALSHT